MTTPTHGKCQGTRKDGSPCNSPAAGPDQLCYWHSGRYSDTERSAAARRGAEAIQRKPLPETPDAMRSPEHAILLLQQVVDELRANTIDTRRANAIAFAVKAAVSCWDVAVSAKLNRLEKLLNGRGRTR